MRRFTPCHQPQQPPAKRLLDPRTRPTSSCATKNACCRKPPTLLDNGRCGSHDRRQQTPAQTAGRHDQSAAAALSKPAGQTRGLRRSVIPSPLPAPGNLRTCRKMAFGAVQPLHLPQTRTGAAKRPPSKRRKLVEQEVPVVWDILDEVIGNTPSCSTAHPPAPLGHSGARSRF